MNKQVLKTYDRMLFIHILREIKSNCAIKWLWAVGEKTLTFITAQGCIPPFRCFVNIDSHPRNTPFRQCSISQSAEMLRIRFEYLNYCQRVAKKLSMISIQNLEPILPESSAVENSWIMKQNQRTIGPVSLI